MRYIADAIRYSKNLRESLIMLTEDDVEETLEARRESELDFTLTWGRWDRQHSSRDLPFSVCHYYQRHDRRLHGENIGHVDQIDTKR